MAEANSVFLILVCNSSHSQRVFLSVALVRIILFLLSLSLILALILNDPPVKKECEEIAAG